MCPLFLFYCLIVIDMQPYWKVSNDPLLLDNVKKEIIAARDRGCPIIFLEYRDKYHKAKKYDTHDCLTALVRDYEDRYRIVPKLESNGSDEIILACKEAPRLPQDYFRVCGILADKCVLVTVKSLAVKRPTAKIEVIADACRPSRADVDMEELWALYSRSTTNVTVCHSLAG